MAASRRYLLSLVSQLASWCRLPLQGDTPLRLEATGAKNALSLLMFLLTICRLHYSATFLHQGREHSVSDPGDTMLQDGLSGS
jgi:hypothetical protein